MLAGTLLARDARSGGGRLQLAYGDQPALICELVDGAELTASPIIAAGKGTKYRPEYHASTPDDGWGHYGLTAEQARIGGINPKMFNSFLDGPSRGSRWRRLPMPPAWTPPPDGLGVPTVRHARDGGDAASRQRSARLYQTPARWR